MNSLRIQQGQNIEVVSTNLIKKLYEVALSVPEPLEGEQDAAYLSGNLQVDKSYRTQVEYLTNRFDDLHINVTGGYYVSFKDQNALNLLISKGIGDGVGITQEDLAGATLSDVVFNNVDYFPEFELFISMTTLQSNMGINVSNLKELSLPFTTMNAGLSGIGNVEILIAKKLQTLSQCLSWELPEGLSLIYLGASQFNFNRGDDFTFITSDKNYSTVPGRFLYIPNATSITGGGDSVFGNRQYKTKWVYSIVYIKGVQGTSTNIGPNVFKNCIITNFVINNTTLPTISSIPNIANLYVPESILTKTGNTYQLTDSTSAWNVSGINYYPIEELDTVDTIDLWKQQSKPTKLISELM